VSSTAIQHDIVTITCDQHADAGQPLDKFNAFDKPSDRNEAMHDE
jgi:hypothetical protein